MRRIGVRELRQNASVYLRLVKAGETIEVTERGVPVAVLAPPAADPPEKKTRREELIERGLMTPAQGDWREVVPLDPAPGVPLASDILARMREDER